MVREPEIGRKIKNIRQEKQLSQSEVVNKLARQGINMSRETLSKIETNSRSISALELKTLCNIFHVNMNDFFPKEESEDLVTFFRKRNVSNETLKEITMLQNMVKNFLKHEKIYKGQLKS